MTPNPRIAALAADMIFASKIRGTADALGVPVAMASSVKRLIEAAGSIGPEVILLDLDTRGLDITAAIEALRAAAPSAEIIAYVSHVRADAIETARLAGARVLARSAFTRMLPEILRAG